VSRGGNVRNVHISGCDIESNMSESTLPTANIFIDCRGSQYGTAEVAITGCTIQHNSDGPDSCNIRILGHSDQAQTSEPAHEGNVAITGNVLSDVQTNIWLEACRGVTITGNTLWMGFEHNLLIDNCSHVVMGSNNFDRNPRYDYGRSNEAKNRLVFRRSRDCTVMGLHVSRVSNEPAVWLQDCDRFNVSGMTILDCEIGLKLENVTRSLFTACLIRDDREQPGRSRPVVIEGGSDNRFDSSFSN
jgi:hypothetical protein